MKKILLAIAAFAAFNANAATLKCSDGSTLTITKSHVHLGDVTLRIVAQDAFQIAAVEESFNDRRVFIDRTTGNVSRRGEKTVSIACRLPLF